MTLRQELHRIVDELPEEELNELRRFLEDLASGAQPDEPLSSELLAAVNEGLDDVQAGRTVAWDQVKREHGLGVIA